MARFQNITNFILSQVNMVAVSAIVIRTPQGSSGAWVSALSGASCESQLANAPDCRSQRRSHMVMALLRPGAGMTQEFEGTSMVTSERAHEAALFWMLPW